MALKDLLSLADDKLAEVFAKKPHDPAKARTPILKGIDRTKNQHASATPVRGKKWFKVANGVVQVTLPFEIAGKSTFHLPSERFVEWLDHLKDSVTKGELDKEIEAGASKSPRAPKISGGGGKGWSPERRARFAASIEARKKAKK